MAHCNQGLLASVMKETERLGYLDSIRGVAAMTVVLSHCWLVKPINYSDPHGQLSTGLTSFSNLFSYVLIKYFECGRSAVITFFVLSGFVLAQSLLKQQTPYTGYAIKRVFRIYPAFLLIIITTYVLHFIIGDQYDSNSEYVRKLNNPDLSFATLIKHLIMYGTKVGMGLNFVVWTLVYEMRISLIFPLILHSVSKYRWRSIAVYLLLSIVCTGCLFLTTGSVASGRDEVTFLQTLFTTGYFVIFFAGGAFLAIEREEVARKVARLSRWKKIVILVIVILCFLKSDYSNFSLKFNVVDYARGLSAIALIALALGTRKISNVLNHGVLVWLGRISYSLYLVHLPILYVIIQTVGASWSPIAIGIATIALSLLAAELMARTIEFPFISLGKKLCAKLAYARPA